MGITYYKHLQMEESLGNANREVANATQDVRSAGGLDNDMDLNN